MTLDIARFMRKLEALWDEHLEASLVRRDVDASLAQMTDEPSVRHVPVMSGAVGRPALRQFYDTDFFPSLPETLGLHRVSRTVDRFHLVDETTISFLHDRELPWLLPGIAPTGRRAEVLTIAVVSFERGRISSQRFLWDYATLTDQLGLATVTLGTAGG